jgi:hypothetical protein
MALFSHPMCASEEMPFCAKCGLFFAKGNQCSCITGLSPADASLSPRNQAEPAASHAPAPVRVEVPVSKPKPVSHVASRPKQEEPRRVVSAASSSDRGQVVAETSSATSKYCAGCSEPKSLCKCEAEKGEPFYKTQQSTQAPVSSAAFCSVCFEPRGLCSCKSVAAASTSPRRAAVPSGESARSESNSQYAQPAREQVKHEVSKEASVMGGSKFCAGDNQKMEQKMLILFCKECGEPLKLCRCQSIQEGRQILDPETGKWL